MLLINGGGVLTMRNVVTSIAPEAASHRVTRVVALPAGIKPTTFRIMALPAGIKPTAFRIINPPSIYTHPVLYKQASMDWPQGLPLNGGRLWVGGRKFTFKASAP